MHTKLMLESKNLVYVKSHICCLKGLNSEASVHHFFMHNDNIRSSSIHLLVQYTVNKTVCHGDMHDSVNKL